MTLNAAHAGRRVLVRWVDLVRRAAAPVVVLAVLATLGGAVYTAKNIGINTSTTDMLSADLPFRRNANAIKQALMIFCLNDVSVVSASEIRTTVTRAIADQPVALSAGIDVQSLKEMPLVDSLNGYLRARSSLYVWVRGSLTDPQTRYWQNELANYNKLSEESLAQILDPIDRIAKRYGTAEIPFTVFVMPFAGQMGLNESSLPQKNITAFFLRNGIDFVDLLPRFRAEKFSKELFLPFDPMHLSPEGHEVLFQVIGEQIRSHQTASLER